MSQGHRKKLLEFWFWESAEELYRDAAICWPSNSRNQLIDDRQSIGYCKNCNTPYFVTPFNGGFCGLKCRREAIL
jgi:hypothetical protein